MISKKDVVKINGNQIDFVPTEGFDYSEPYKFGYTISSNGNNDTAIVSLEFNQTSTNHPPVLSPDVVYAEHLGSVRITPLENDSDQDNDPLVITAAFSDSGNTVNNGKELIFTPNSDFVGTDAQILFSALNHLLQ